MIRWDDKADCPRCEARCHDVLEQRPRKRLLIACCFCGALLEVPGSVSVPGDTTLSQGRFAGLKLSEVLLEPSGLEYLEWLAGSTPHMREAIEEVKRAAVRDQGAGVITAPAASQPVVDQNSGSRQPVLHPFHGRAGAPPPPTGGGGALLFD